MGFWKKVGQALGGAVSSTGNVVSRVGKTVQKVAEWAGVDEIETVGSWLDSGGETLTGWGERLKETTSEAAQELGCKTSYDGSRSTVEETVDINKALTELNRKLEPQIESVELGAVNALQNYFIRIKQAFVNETSDEIQLDIDIERLNRNAENAITAIKDKVNKHISSRASLSDEECEDILNMKPGKKKRKQTEQFIRSVLSDGLETLATDIRLIANEQQQQIETVLEDKLGDMLKRQETQIQELQEIERAAHEGDTERQLKKEKVTATLNYCDFAIEELHID